MNGKIVLLCKPGDEYASTGLELITGHKMEEAEDAFGLNYHQDFDELV